VSFVLRFRDYRLWQGALFLGLAGLANLAARCVQDWLFLMLAVGVPHLTILLKQAVMQRRPCDALPLGLQLVLRTDRACKRSLNAPLLRFQWHWPAAVFLLPPAVALGPPLVRRRAV